jgi:integrase
MEIHVTYRPIFLPLSIAVSGRLSVPFRTGIFARWQICLASAPAIAWRPAASRTGSGSLQARIWVSTRSGHLARSLPRTRQKAAVPHAGRSARIRRGQGAGRGLARPARRLTGSRHQERYRHRRPGELPDGLATPWPPEAAKKAEGQFKTALGFDRKDEAVQRSYCCTALEGATKDDFLDWRDRLRPGRLPRTVNRFVRAVTAGLNRAHDLGHIGNPAAWRIEALADDESETAVFLSPAQRKGLIDSASPEAAAFLRGLELSGARPKELAEATAADFDGERLKLSHRKGRPPKLRSRYVVLDQMGSRSSGHGRTGSRRLIGFSRQLRGNRGVATCGLKKSAPLSLCTTNVRVRKRAFQSGASAYSFRHARISELLQVYGVDPLTVAAQTGTSLRMIERAYFKFIRSAMLEKLASLSAKPLGD